MSEKKEEIISIRAKIGEVMYRVKGNASSPLGNSENTNIAEQNIWPDVGGHLLYEVYETTPGKRAKKTMSDMQVYAVVSTSLLMMLLVVAEGTSWFQSIAIGVGVAVSMSLVYLLADKFDLAKRLMKLIKRLG